MNIKKKIDWYSVSSSHLYSDRPYHRGGDYFAVADDPLTALKLFSPGALFY